MKQQRWLYTLASTHKISDADSTVVGLVGLFFSSPPQAKFWNRLPEQGTMCHGLQSCAGWDPAPPRIRSLHQMQAERHRGAVFMQAMYQCTNCTKKCLSKNLFLGFACSKAAFTVHLLFNFFNSHIFKSLFPSVGFIAGLFLTYVDDYFSCWPCFSVV